MKHLQVAGGELGPGEWQPSHGFPALLLAPVWMLHPLPELPLWVFHTHQKQAVHCPPTTDLLYFKATPNPPAALATPPWRLCLKVTVPPCLSPMLLFSLGSLIPSLGVLEESHDKPQHPQLPCSILQSLGTECGSGVAVTPENFVNFLLRLLCHSLDRVRKGTSKSSGNMELRFIVVPNTEIHA